MALPRKLASLLIIFSYISIVKSYSGSDFPKKYLKAEDIVPTTEDLELYLLGVRKILNYMTEKTLNKTDPNQAFGLFYMKAILKRTLIENSEKILPKHCKDIKDILNSSENLLSYFFYALRHLKWNDMLKRVAELFKEDSLQVRSIAKFNTNRLTKWILREGEVNIYGEAMDNIVLPKEKYLELVQSIDYNDFFISISESDYCLSQIMNNPMPWDLKMRRCVASEKCADLAYKWPSVAYSLSHKMINVLMPRHIRRCYQRSRQEDYDLLNELCASMYRETVYLARRGYFFRDIFMEHVGVCSLLGYKEFHRRHWFHKVVSWIDENGCIQEDLNFETNRTTYLLRRETSEEKRREVRKRHKELLADPCHQHQMALAIIMLAHGIRHAVHFSVP